MRSPIVAIVDDDPSVREAAKTFEGADQFLKSYSADKTTCLIADVQMPGMSGLELHNRPVRRPKSSGARMHS
jgi:FixJ family two-component response regulator